MNPSARTLAYLRDLGYHAAVVEKWNAFAGPVINGKPVGQRQDLFGVFDVLAFSSLEVPMDDYCVRRGVLAVQSTSGSNLSARLEKLLAAPVVRDFLLAGNRVEIHAWRKLKKAVDRKFWQVKIRPITLEDYEAVQQNPETRRV